MGRSVGRIEFMLFCLDPYYPYTERNTVRFWEKGEEFKLSS